MAVQIQFRRDTSANWASANPVLAAGEMGINTTTTQFKIGDGTTAWNSLSYASLSGTVADLDDITNVVITSATNGDLLKWNGSAWVNAAGYALLASPTFTGTPTLPTGTIATTQTAGNNTTAVATTAFVTGAVTDLIGGAPGALNTLNELAEAINDDASYAAGITTALGLKAPLASPTFTGTVTIPTGASITSPTLAGTAVTASGNLAVQPYTNILEIKGDNAAVVGQLQLNCHVNTHGQKIASQPHSEAASNTLKLPGGTTIGNADAVLVSDTGTQTLSNKTLASGTIAVTQTANNNSTAIATTAYVDTAGALKANLASPTFTGTPTLPTGTIATTQTANNNSTAIATTAYVDNQAAAAASALSVDGLSDTTITSAASGQFLKYNGSAWVNDAIDLTTDTVGNYMVGVSAGAGISVSHTPGEGSTATISAIPDDDQFVLAAAIFS